jgi:hypothetical protein
VIDNITLKRDLQAPEIAAGKSTVVQSEAK